MVPEHRQLIHLQGLPELLLALVLEGAALLEADEHQVVPVGQGESFPRLGHPGGGVPEALVGLQLPALQDDQEALAVPPEGQVQHLSRGLAAGFEEGPALVRQGIDVGADLLLSLEGPGQGPLGLAFQGLPQLAQGLEPEAESGGHQACAFRKGARSMPKIWPMASMAWRWSELSAVACRRKYWMGAWNWMAWSMAVLDSLV